jgi:pimeloyl-ACP methyl ester carboxylesterase
MADADIRRFDLDLPHRIRLACRAAAAPPRAGAPRVLLLHGFPEAAFVWDEVLRRLAGEVAAVAPNLRGFAGSSAPPDVADYRAKVLMADLVALIDSMGAPLDLLVAHDWGGALAWNLAAQRPELLRRLLIVNSPHPATFLRELRESAEQQAASAYMNFLCRPDAERLLAENDFARLWPFFNGGDGTAPWLTEAVKAQFRAVWAGDGLRGPLNYYRASPLRPPLAAGDPVNTLVLPDEAVTVHLPTRVLWGLQDAALRPGLLHGLERWVPRLQVQTLADASHWVVHEQPDTVVGAIRQALRD